MPKLNVATLLVSYGVPCFHQVARLPPSDPDQHARFQKKLTWNDLSRRGRSRRGDDGERNEDDETGEDASAGPKGGDTKDTPLEKQVVELKKKHPGVLLLIEVGYKYHCYGSDAEVAAQVRLCSGSCSVCLSTLGVS